MRSISSVILSLAAMALSSLTTYLSFFDARYTLNTAVASVRAGVQQGSSSSNGQRDLYFNSFVEPLIILSNRGTRPLVLTDIKLVPSTDLARCDVPEGTKPANRLGADIPAATIIEADTVKELPMEFALVPNVEAREGPNGFDLPDSETLWCLKWTIFDHAGRRSEPMTQAFTLKTTFSVDEGDDYPSAHLKVDYPKRPQKLVSRGLF